MVEKNTQLVEDVQFIDALSDRYLAYALSTIMSRSLPDVRDGLKPVHRRLIYAMYLLKLDPQSGFKKCARVVGDVIGKFHPHGDVAVYDALVRLAQNFSARYPLVEGQGNFGSVDGDNAAAMRYTESKLTIFAMMLLEDLEHDVVDFRLTYDGEDKEPIVLPASFPNLLANGASGIAVGMATNIPPHNIIELCDAAKALIDKPDLTTQELIHYVTGPDFPTGGVVIEDQDGLVDAYESGRGYFRIRAKWDVSEGKFGAWRIIVSELPYQVQTGRVIKQIADLLEQKKLPLLGDIYDESTDVVRLVLEPKNRNVDPQVLMETLFKATALETRFSLNMNVLGPNSVPGVMGLKKVLQTWLEHRMDVLERCCRYHHHQIDQRMEVLKGFLVVFLNIDEVIRIIRTEDEPRGKLMERFSLTQRQAEAILNMRLRSLRRLEEMTVREELKDLQGKYQYLESLLADEAKRWQHIAADLKKKKELFRKYPVTRRKTKIVKDVPQVDISSAALIEREPLTLIVSRKGWVKSMKGHHIDTKNLKFKEGDDLLLAKTCHSTDELCFCTSQGRSFCLKGEQLPSGRGDGQALRLLFPLATDEKLVDAFPLDQEMSYLFATSLGRGLILKGKSLYASKRSGRQIVNLKEGDYVCHISQAIGDYVAVLSSRNRFLIFPMHQIPVLGRGQGVILQKYPPQTKLKKIVCFSKEEGLVWPGFVRSRPISDLEKWIGNRGTVGRQSPSWTGKGQTSLL